MAQAAERHQVGGRQTLHPPARPLGRLHRHRADDARHARAVDTGIGTEAVHHVRPGAVRGRDAEAEQGPGGGVQQLQLVAEEQRVRGQEQLQVGVSEVFVFGSGGSLAGCVLKRSKTTQYYSK